MNRAGLYTSLYRIVSSINPGHRLMLPTDITPSNYSNIPRLSPLLKFIHCVSLQLTQCHVFIRAITFLRSRFGYLFSRWRSISPGSVCPQYSRHFSEYQQTGVYTRFPEPSVPEQGFPLNSRGFVHSNQMRYTHMFICFTLLDLALSPLSASTT